MVVLLILSLYRLHHKFLKIIFDLKTFLKILFILKKKEEEGKELLKMLCFWLRRMGKLDCPKMEIEEEEKF